MRGLLNLNVNTRTVSLLLVATLCLSEGTHVGHSLYHPTKCEKVKILISDLGKVKLSNESDVTVPIFRQFVRAESQHLSRLSRQALLGGSRFALTGPPPRSPPVLIIQGLGPLQSTHNLVVHLRCVSRYCWPRSDTIGTVADDSHTTPAGGVSDARCLPMIRW